MKRALSLILAFVLCFSLCACRDIHDTSTTNGNESIVDPTGTTTDKEIVPSENLIKADLQESLAKHNAHATISSVVIEKSLTEEKSFSATVLVTAKTKYADWSYEVMVAYTKYDQGWFLDNADWNSGEYALVQSPDVDTVIDWINDTDISYAFWNDMKPTVEDMVVIEDTANEDELLISWVKFTMLAHADSFTAYTMRMKYDPMTDTWVYIQYSEEERWLEETGINPHNVDLSGNWDGVKIENFTWGSFDLSATSNFGDVINGHFFRIDGHPYSGEKSFGWYSNGNGYYCQIRCGTDGSSLAIYSFSAYGRTVTQHVYVSIG